MQIHTHLYWQTSAYLAQVQYDHLSLCQQRNAKKKISDVNYRRISFNAFGVKSRESYSYICKCHLHLALSLVLSSSWLGRTPHMHQRTLSCPCCVTGVCELVPGWGSVSSWNIYSDREREVIARLQRREGSWYPRVENKYLWKIPLASEHFPTHAWNTHTHTGKEERDNKQPVTLINIQSTVFHSAVLFTIIADGSRMRAALLLHADGTKRLLL